MGQIEVIKLLEKEKRWMSAREIADSLDIKVDNVYRVLIQLQKYREILCNNFKDENSGFSKRKWRYKD